MVLSWSRGTSDNPAGFVRLVDGVAFVCLRGELDLTTAPALRELLEAARAAPASGIVVDLADVSFIDASTVGAIVSAWSRCEEAGRLMRVDGLAEQPARVFDILGLRGLLTAPRPRVGTTGRTS